MPYTVSMKRTIDEKDELKYYVYSGSIINPDANDPTGFTFLSEEYGNQPVYLDASKKIGTVRKIYSNTTSDGEIVYIKLSCPDGDEEHRFLIRSEDITKSVETTSSSGKRVTLTEFEVQDKPEMFTCRIPMGAIYDTESGKYVLTIPNPECFQPLSTIEAVYDPSLRDNKDARFYITPTQTFSIDVFFPCGDVSTYKQYTVTKCSNGVLYVDNIELPQQPVVAEIEFNDYDYVCCDSRASLCSVYFPGDLTTSAPTVCSITEPKIEKVKAKDGKTDEITLIPRYYECECSGNGGNRGVVAIFVSENKDDNPEDDENYTELSPQCEVSAFDSDSIPVYSKGLHYIKPNRQFRVCSLSNKPLFIKANYFSTAKDSTYVMPSGWSRSVELCPKPSIPVVRGGYIPPENLIYDEYKSGNLVVFSADNAEKFEIVVASPSFVSSTKFNSNASLSELGLENNPNVYACAEIDNNEEYNCFYLPPINADRVVVYIRSTSSDHKSAWSTNGYTLLRNGNFARTFTQNELLSYAKQVKVKSVDLAQKTTTFLEAGVEKTKQSVVATVKFCSTPYKKAYQFVKKDGKQALELSDEICDSPIGYFCPALGTYKICAQTYEWFFDETDGLFKSVSGESKEIQPTENLEASDLYGASDTVDVEFDDTTNGDYLCVFAAICENEENADFIDVNYTASKRTDISSGEISYDPREPEDYEALDDYVGIYNTYSAYKPAINQYIAETNTYITFKNQMIPVKCKYGVVKATSEQECWDFIKKGFRIREADPNTPILLDYVDTDNGGITNNIPDGYYYLIYSVYPERNSVAFPYYLRGSWKILKFRRGRRTSWCDTWIASPGAVGNVMKYRLSVTLDSAYTFIQVRQRKEGQGIEEGWDYVEDENGYVLSGTFDHVDPVGGEIELAPNKQYEVRYGIYSRSDYAKTTREDRLVYESVSPVVTGDILDQTLPRLDAPTNVRCRQEGNGLRVLWDGGEDVLIRVRGNGWVFNSYHPYGDNGTLIHYNLFPKDFDWSAFTISLKSLANYDANHLNSEEVSYIVKVAGVPYIGIENSRTRRALTFQNAIGENADSSSLCMRRFKYFMLDEEKTLSDLNVLSSSDPSSVVDLDDLSQDAEKFYFILPEQVSLKSNAYVYIRFLLDDEDGYAAGYGDAVELLGDGVVNLITGPFARCGEGGINHLSTRYGDYTYAFPACPNIELDSVKDIRYSYVDGKLHIYWSPVKNAEGYECRIRDNRYGLSTLDIIRTKHIGITLDWIGEGKNIYVTVIPLAVCDGESWASSNNVLMAGDESIYSDGNPETIEISDEETTSSEYPLQQYTSVKLYAEPVDIEDAVNKGYVDSKFVTRTELTTFASDYTSFADKYFKKTTVPETYTIDQIKTQLSAEFATVESGTVISVFKLNGDGNEVELVKFIKLSGLWYIESGSEEVELTTTGSGEYTIRHHFERPYIDVSVYDNDGEEVFVGHKVVSTKDSDGLYGLRLSFATGTPGTYKVICQR